MVIPVTSAAMHLLKIAREIGEGGRRHHNYRLIIYFNMTHNCQTLDYR